MAYACYGKIENGYVYFHTLKAGNDPRVFSGKAMVVWIQEDFKQEFVVKKEFV